MCVLARETAMKHFRFLLVESFFTTTSRVIECDGIRAIGIGKDYRSKQSATAPADVMKIYQTLILFHQGLHRSRLSSESARATSDAVPARTPNRDSESEKHLLKVRYHVLRARFRDSIIDPMHSSSTFSPISRGAGRCHASIFKSLIHVKCIHYQDCRMCNRPIVVKSQRDTEIARLAMNQGLKKGRFVHGPRLLLS